MENQFNDLTKPNIDKEYYYTNNIRCKGFTYLMKLVLVVKKFPKAKEMIQEIISKEPLELVKQNEDGWTALMLACRHSNTYSNVETVRLLIDAGADVNIVDNFGYTALILACRKLNADNNIDTIKMLIDAGADVNAVDDDDCTVLLSVCARSNIETVRLLIDAGADLNAPDSNGCTALMIASRYSNKQTNNEIVRLLIAAGADLNAVDRHGRTALMIACRYSNTTSNTETVRLLIDAGSDINACSDMNETALIMASNNETFRMLIAAGADVNIRSFCGTALLLLLAETNREKPGENRVEKVKLLIDTGADLDDTDLQHGWSVLMIACYNSVNYFSIKCTKMLIKAGANLNLQDDKMRTCLIKLCQKSTVNNNIEKIKILIKAGADVNIKDKFGNTALIYLIKSGLFEYCKKVLLLLMKLSRKTICDKNNKNKTAYDYYKKRINDDTPVFIGDEEDIKCILNKSELKILKGKTVFNSTKSARNYL